MKLFSNNTNIGLRHLRAAVTVMEEGSFSRAAGRLGVVPSALTEAVQHLERECGTQIFDRKTRPVRPTPAGTTFLDEARRLLDRVEASLVNLIQAGSAERGRVAIGAAPSAVLDPLCDVIARYRSEYPGVEIIVHDDVAERLGAMVADRTLDFAVAGRALASPDLSEVKIGEDAFGLVCHRDHALARARRPIRLADIDPDDVISLQGQTGIARILADAPDVPDALRTGRIQAFSTIAQLTLISANAGVALLPSRAAKVIQSDAIRFREIEDLALVRTLFLITRSRSTLAPAAERFIGCLLRTAHGPDRPTPGRRRRR